MVESKSFGSRLFDVLNYALLFVLTVVFLYPLWYVLVGSISDPVRLFMHNGLLWRPLGFSLQGYRTMLQNPNVGIGYAMFGYLYKKDSHVDVKFVEMMLPPLGKKIVELFRDLFIFAYSVVMIYWGTKLAGMNVDHLVPATKISYAWGYVLIVIGAFSGAVRSLWAIIARIVGFFGKKSDKEAGK